jgi:hypothetical protein
VVFQMVWALYYRKPGNIIKCNLGKCKLDVFELNTFFFDYVVKPAPMPVPRLSGDRD